MKLKSMVIKSGAVVVCASHLPEKCLNHVSDHNVVIKLVFSETQTSQV
jgi:hypothetical protein